MFYVLVSFLVICAYVAFALLVAKALGYATRQDLPDVLLGPSSSDEAEAGVALYPSCARDVQATVRELR